MAETIIISSGVSSSGEIIKFGNSVTVTDGGSVANYTLEEQGYLHVKSGGSADLTVISGGGQMVVSSSGKAISTKLYNNGSLTAVGSNAVLADGTAASGGVLVLSSGAVLEDWNISSGVNLSVFSDALISGGAIAANFELAGSAIGVELTGSTNVNGGSLNSVTIRNTAILISGASAQDTSLQGTLQVEVGGTAVSTTVSNGKLEVFSGGTAKENIISGGSMVVSSGGYVSGTVLSNGAMLIDSGAEASATVVNSTAGSSAALQINGSALGLTVSSGGRVVVNSGGYIGDVVLEKGSWFYINEGAKIGTVTVNAGSEINGFIFKSDVSFNGSLKFSSAYVAKDAVGEVFSGQTAIDAFVEYGGDLRVASGGKLDNVTISSGGRINGFLVEETQVGISAVNLNSALVSGSKDNYDRLQKISAVLYDGETASNTKVTSGGVLYVSSGASAHIDYWQPCVGSIYVAEGGQISYASAYTGWYLGGDDQLVSCGASNTDKHFVGKWSRYNSDTGERSSMNTMQVHVMASGQMDQTHVGYDGEVFVYSGGLIRTTVIDHEIQSNGSGWQSSSGGTVHISNGGSAASTTLKGKDALMRIYSGGNASKIFMDQGEVEILAGGIATDFYHYGIGQEVESSVDQGWFKSANTENLDKGVCNSARVYVRDNARVERAAIFSSGSMSVDDGGRVDYAVVFDRGQLNLAKDAKHTNVTIKEFGRLKVAEGNEGQNLSVKTGGVVNGFIFTADKVYAKRVDVYENTSVYTGSGYSNLQDAILYGNQRALRTVVSDGSMSAYGAIDSTFIQSDGSVSLHSGASAKNTQVSS